MRIKMAKNEELTAEYLRSILVYDPMIGEFRWIARFDAPEDAHAAYIEASALNFGEFARIG
jgi:hypothetical protein